MGTVGAGDAMRNGNTVNEASAANRQRSLLTKEDRLAIDRAIHSIYELQDLDAFVVEAMRVLPPLIQADLSAYNEVNYAERRMMTIIDFTHCTAVVSRQSGDVRSEYASESAH